MTTERDTSPILLVEDDEVLGHLLARHTRARGFDVVEASTAEDAVSRLGDGLRPALVLLDINLPGDTGWSVLRHQAYVDAGRPPVVVISATSVSPDRLHEFDCAGFLPKPFPLETLIATVERIVDPTMENAST